MRTILILNAKGGCGKTTLATHVACHYANEGQEVVLADFDPQRGSIDWLAARDSRYPTITGLDAVDHGLRHLPKSAEVLVLDAPARLHGSELSEFLRRAQTVIVPILPSPVDMRAASRFLDELSNTSPMKKKEVRVGLVANRVNEHTKVAGEFRDWLARRREPFLGQLRETQNYVKAASLGISVFELPPYLAWYDWAQWEPIVRWLGSRRSLVGS